MNSAADSTQAAAAAAGLPWLVADVGGTNARFGWIADAAGGVDHVRKLPVAAHAGLGEAAQAYLAELAPLIGGAAPHKAAIAVATAIRGDHVHLTNSDWSFSRAALAQRLKLDSLLVLNDFEALALSLPRLKASQLRAHGALPQPAGMLAAVGPGTGLGVGGVLQTAHGWVAVAGEGGHATLAAADDFEAQLLAAVRAEHPHVSAERLLSGIGLPTLHAGVASVLGQRTETLDARAIVERFNAGGDALCRRTIDVFCAMLGGFAGNVALTLGARGGLYIAGGIVPRLGDAFFASAFRQRFEDKGRFSDYLRAIPTALVTDTLAALAGAAHAIEQHAR
jgi:glucokinase